MHKSEDTIQKYIKDLLQSISIIVFDFDGVITSLGEAAKEDAWDVLSTRLRSEDDINHDIFVSALKKVRIDLGGGKGGGTRHDILRTSLAESSKNGEALVSYYADLYGQIALELILDGGLSSGAREVLRRLKEKNIPLYINSATPETPLFELLKQLDIHTYFKGVFGFSDNPSVKITKAQNLRAIMVEAGISDSTKMLFVGDGTGDAKAADEVGCQFIGFGNYWNKWRDGEKPFPIITSLRELLNRVS